MRNAYNLLIGKPEGKIPLGRPRHKRENKITVFTRIKDDPAYKTTPPPLHKLQFSGKYQYSH
jgi:hypothetical protein